ncbi:MAG: nitrate- and nitrite sensing domain-containing protein [Thalassotalea sp.]
MILTLTSLVVLLFTTMVFIKQKRQRHKKQTQLQGITLIGQLKQLITLVQQHRGLTSAWLSGDSKVKTKLVVLKQQISQVIKSLEITQVQQNERWIAFVDHWPRLLQFNNLTSVGNSFDQHTMMIRNLAYLLEDTAEHSFLTAEYIPALPNVGYVWRELVLATENIGQSRALGTGVAAKSLCSSVDKVRLNFLTQTMTKITEHTLQNLSFLPEEQSVHRQLIASTSVKMNQLITTITNDLVNASKVIVDNGLYFELATETMKAMNDIFDHQIKQLNNII